MLLCASGAVDLQHHDTGPRQAGAAGCLRAPARRDAGCGRAAKHSRVQHPAVGRSAGCWQAAVLACPAEGMSGPGIGGQRMLNTLANQPACHALAHVSARSLTMPFDFGGRP